MTPHTSRTRGRRVARIVVNVVLVPVWVLVAFICLHSFVNYSDVANLTLLALIMMFALWAWWYGEDRDRRRAAAREHEEANGRLAASAGRNGD